MCVHPQASTTPIKAEVCQSRRTCLSGQLGESTKRHKGEGTGFWVWTDRKPKYLSSEPVSVPGVLLHRSCMIPTQLYLEELMFENTSALSFQKFSGWDLWYSRLKVFNLQQSEKCLSEKNVFNQKGFIFPHCKYIKSKKKIHTNIFIQVGIQGQLQSLG